MMANSESEDFESADEDVPKSIESRIEQQGENVTSTPTDYLADKLRPSGVVGGSNEFLSKVSSKHPVADSDASQALSSPERLGAKPKVFQGSNRKYPSKGRNEGFKDCDTSSVGFSASSKGDSKMIRKQGPSKLGVRIQKPLSLDSSDMDISSDLDISNNDCSRSKEKGRGRVSWSVDVRDDSTEEEPIQPLLGKLASVHLNKPQDSSEKGPDVSKADSVDHTTGWGSWGSWGMNTILSGASSVTSHVTQSLSTVTSAIETGLGAVEPEEMARINAEDKLLLGTVSSNSGEDSPVHQGSEASSSSILSMGLRFMESTGGMIVASGLNTLETIGKKTMDVLQEGDPGLKKKRALLSRETDKPSLSQVLKEARLKADSEDRERARLKKASKAHFETLFDDYRGMVHLEALEMLSHTCQIKVEAKHVLLSGPQLIDFQRTLAHIKEQCELPDEDDEDDEDHGSVEVLERDLAAAMRGLMVAVSHAKLIRISEDTDSWLNSMKCVNEDEGSVENDEWPEEDMVSDETDHHSSLQDIHQQAIRALAQFTAAVTEHFHKTAELLLLKEEHNSTLEAQSLVMMTTVLCSRVSSVAARFSELLSTTANTMNGVRINHNDVNSLITNVFLEASNSSSYIQDASNLLIPVLQLGGIQ